MERPAASSALSTAVPLHHGSVHCGSSTMSLGIPSQHAQGSTFLTSSKSSSALPASPLTPSQTSSLEVLDEARRGRKERLRADARKGDEIVVPLTRPIHSKNIPLGLKFNDCTMELISCAEGSRASSSAPVCACVGLVLLHRSLGLITTI